MTMKSGLRKFALTAHITCSIGWLGAVVSFLGLAVVGFTSQDELTARGAYRVMEPAAWFALVPLAFASLLTGIVMSLGTVWGMFRHYWVVIKLLITGISTIVLLVYMETFRSMAAVAADVNIDLVRVRNPSPILHATLALLLLLVATVLAVYKPLGMTAYGRRKQAEQEQRSQAMYPQGTTPAFGSGTNRRRWVYMSWIVAISILVLFLALHLMGGGLHGH